MFLAIIQLLSKSFPESTLLLILLLLLLSESSFPFAGGFTAFSVFVTAAGFDDIPPVVFCFIGDVCMPGRESIKVLFLVEAVKKQQGLPS